MVQKSAKIASEKVGQPLKVPPAEEASRWLVRGRDLAELFGVSLRTIFRYRSCGMPQRARGRYSLVEAIAWKIRLVRAESDVANNDERRLGSAMADEREHKAALAGLQRRHREGELVLLADVQAERLERIYACKASLRNLAEVLAGQLVGQTPAQIRAIVKEEVRGCLARFAGEEQNMAGSGKATRRRGEV